MNRSCFIGFIIASCTIFGTYTLPLSEGDVCDRLANMTLNSTEYAGIYEELHKFSPEVRTSVCDMIIRDADKTEKLSRAFKKWSIKNCLHTHNHQNTIIEADEDYEEELIGGMVALGLKEVGSYVYRKTIRKWCCCCCCKKQRTSEQPPIELDVQNV